jgi:hypothetical protein
MTAETATKILDPWRMGELNGSIVDSEGDVIAHVVMLEGTPDLEEMGLANAALMVAAPDMLYACQWALNTLRDAVVCPDGCPEELEAALVSAIAKAEGR